MNEEEKRKKINKISIFFEVFSIDSKNVNHYEGFAILRIPNIP